MPVSHPTDMGLTLHTVKSSKKLWEDKEWGLGCWPGVWEELCSVPCFGKSLLCYLEQVTQGQCPEAPGCHCVTSPQPGPRGHGWEMKSPCRRPLMFILLWDSGAMLMGHWHPNSGRRQVEGLEQQTAWCRWLNQGAAS